VQLLFALETHCCLAEIYTLIQANWITPLFFGVGEYNSHLLGIFHFVIFLTQGPVSIVINSVKLVQHIE